MRSGGGVWRVAERAELTALRAAGNDIGLIWMQTLLRLREDCSAAKGGLGIVCPSIIRMAAYSNSVCRTWVWIGDKVCKHGGSRQKLTYEREATRRRLDLRVSAKSQQFCVCIWRCLWSPCWLPPGVWAIPFLYTGSWNSSMETF